MPDKSSPGLTGWLHQLMDSGFCTVPLTTCCHPHLTLTTSCSNQTEEELGGRGHTQSFKDIVWKFYTLCLAHLSHIVKSCVHLYLGKNWIQLLSFYYNFIPHFQPFSEIDMECFSFSFVNPAFRIVIEFPLCVSHPFQTFV
jgi:hypothetical protein